MNERLIRAIESALGRLIKAGEDTFIEEVHRAGLDIEAYFGHSFRNYPAVRVGTDAELVALFRATTGPVQWDTLGLGYIVYPVVSN